MVTGTSLGNVAQLVRALASSFGGSGFNLMLGP